MKRNLLVFGAMVLAGLVARPAGAMTFGPDDFGYTALDGAEDGVTYEWVDVAAEGRTALELEDDAQSDVIPLGFDFTFYGKTYNEVSVLSNGVLVFERLLSYGGADGFHGTQCPLPQADPANVNAMVALYERDMNPTDAACGDDCGIWWAVTGEAPNRVFVLTFQAMPVFRDPPTAPASPITAQALLFEGTNDIKIQVAESGDAAGGDATVGIEGADAVAGLAVPGCEVEGSVPDGSVFLFRAPVGGTPVVPPVKVAWGQPGSEIEYAYTVFNLGAATITFDVAASGATWPTEVSVTSLEVLAGGSASFTAAVTIPADAAGGASDEVTFTLTPQGGGEAATAMAMTLVQDAPDEWQEAGTMPGFVESPAVAVVGTDIWLFGGLVWDDLQVGRGVVTAVQVLHTDTMIWENSETDGLAEMPEARADARACAIDGKVYLTGGQTTDEATPVAATVLVYDTAANTWGTATPMPGSRSAHGAVCHGGKLYVMGGYDFSGPEDTLAMYDTLFVFDPTTNAWTTLAPMPATRSDFGAEVIDDGAAILVAGGYVGGFLDAATHRYDIAANAWSDAGDLSVERLLFASAKLDGERMCLIGGLSLNADFEDTYECYSNGFWIPQVALLNAARWWLTGATVGTQMYAIGGAEADHPFQPTEYTPVELVERYPTTELPPPVDAGGGGEDVQGGNDVGTEPGEDIIDPGHDSAVVGTDVPGTLPEQIGPAPDVAGGTDQVAPGGDTGGTNDDNGGGGGGGCTASGGAGGGLGLLLLAGLGLALVRRRRATAL